MKALVVYYSLEGNTKYAAEKIAEITGSDLLPLIPEKAYPAGKVTKYLWGGRSAVMGESPKLMPYQADPEDYDTVILGTPVWAGTFTPPLRTFLQDHSLAGKKIAFFACSAGGKPEKCFDRLQECIGGNAVSARLWLVEPLKRNPERSKEQIEEFCRLLMTQM